MRPGPGRHRRSRRPGDGLVADATLSADAAPVRDTIPNCESSPLARVTNQGERWENDMASVQKNVADAKIFGG